MHCVTLQLKYFVMANENFLEKVASGLGQAATVKNVFGEQIQVGDKTIIPVAKIAYGFGGGYGQGKKRSKPGEGGSNESEGPAGEGGGGGGGMYAKAKGVFEITPSCTRFIPASPVKQILIGMVCGMLVKSLFFSKRRK